MFSFLPTDDIVTAALWNRIHWSPDKFWVWCSWKNTKISVCATRSRWWPWKHRFDLFYLLNKAELSNRASSHGGSHHQGHRELSCPPLFSEAVSKLLMLNFIKLFTIIMNDCVARVSTWLRIYKGHWPCRPAAYFRADAPEKLTANEERLMESEGGAEPTKLADTTRQSLQPQTISQRWTGPLSRCQTSK